VGHDYYNTGRFGDYWGEGMPPQVALEPALIRRGADRYNIYCAVCHGHTGAGDGVTSKYGVPMAAGVLYPLSSHLLLNPMIAAAAMSLSSVSVVANALRLRSMKMGS
jgi:mono/diheme cytochrome c family protein